MISTNGQDGQINQGAKIITDEATSKRIAQVICGEIKASIEGNDKLYKRAKRDENMYSQVTKWMEQDKTCNDPWPGAADYFIPLVEWVVDAIHARILSQIFSQEPYMQASGVEGSDVEKASGVTDFVDMAFRELIRLYDNTNYFWKQVIKLPFAVLKYDTVKEYDRMYVKDKAMTFVDPTTGEEQYILPDDPEAAVKQAQFAMAGLQPAGEKDVWVREEKELQNGPKLQYIRFEDYVWCPNAKRGHRLYWEGDRDWMTVNDIRLKAMQDVFIQQGAQKVVEAHKPEGKSGSDKDLALRAEKVECFHWYGRLPFNEANEVAFDDENAIEQEVYCRVAYKDQELLQIMHWYHKRLPYPDRVYIRGEFEETENFEGRSIADKLYMTQKELNKLHNTIMNNAMIAMQKIFVKKRGLQGEEFQKPQVSWAMWEEDIPGDIRVLEVGDVKAIGLELEASLINYAERLSNISIYQTGTARAEGGKTAREVEATIGEGNVGLDKFVQRCYNIMRKIAQWTVGYYAEEMPPGLERRIRGTDGQMVFPNDDNMAQFQQQNVQPYWKEDDLTGKFDFTWNVSSLNNSKQAQIALANDLMAQYMPQPMVNGNMLAVWEILRRGLVARGIKDWYTILPKKEAIVQEMQKMQMDARAQAIQGNLPGTPGQPVPPPASPVLRRPVNVR